MKRLDFHRHLAKYTPKQVEAWSALREHRYLLYGGARGGGKSRFLRWIAVDKLIEWYRVFGLRDVRWGLFCEDYPTLYDRQISKVRTEFPPFVGKYVDGAKEFRLEPALGGGVVAFRNLDDPSKYQSAEFGGIGVDELTKNGEEVFDILRGSLRWPGLERTLFTAATNPGGRGHLWVKRLWIDGRFPAELRALQEQFAFVQALPDDNPHNSASYLEELKGLPPKLQRAWLEGDWNVFEGQVFEEWRASLHILDGFQVPPTWLWAGGLDFGHRANGVLVVAAAGSENRVVFLDEFVFRGLHAEEAGYQAGQRLKRWPALAYIGADEEMFWQTGVGPTKAEQFQKGLARALPQAPTLVRVTHGKGSRLARLELFRRYLAWKAGPDGTVPEWDMPRARWHKRCKYHIETIPALPYAKTPTGGQVAEDVDTNCFAGNETFLTPDGPVAFADAVGTTGWVWTRFGWRPYAWCRRQRWSSEVVCVTFAGGLSVKCTPEHQWLTTDGRWTQARDLIGQHVACSMPARNGIGTYRDTSAIVVGNNCTDDCGLINSAQFRRVWRSTTLTGMVVTTPSTTCAWLPPPATDDWNHAIEIPERPGAHRGSPTYRWSAKNAGYPTWQPDSIATDNASVPRGVAVRWSAEGARSRPSAPSAVRPSDAARSNEREKRAATSVDGSFVVNVEPIGMDETYCIHVPSVHEFTLSSGLVVHNSEDHAYDADCYFLMSRPLFGDPIPGLREEDTHPGLDARGNRKERAPWMGEFEPEAERPPFRHSEETTEATW